MAAFVMFQNFPEALGKGVHDFTTAGSTYDLKMALCSAINASDGTLAGQTKCTGGGYADKDLSGTHAFTETAGVGTMSYDSTNLVWTASGGTIANVKYAVLYDDIPTGKNVIGYWEYSTSQNVLDTETFTVTFGSSLFTIASA